MKTTSFRWSAIAATIVAAGAVAIACGDDDTTTPVTNPAVDAGRDANTSGSTTSSSGSTTSSSGNPADSGEPTDAGTDGSVDAGPVAVTLNFKAKVGTEDFACGTRYSGIGTASTTIEPADLRFFVTDVALIDGAGNEVPVALDVRSPWQTTEVALLDFENGTGRCSNGNAELNAQVTGKVAPGTYTGIAFTNGIPSATNHGDPATASPPLTAGGMTWGWLFGHLFVKAEVAASADAGIDAGPGYGLLHLGSTGCTNSPDGGDNSNNEAPPTTCKTPNKNRVKLTGFDAATKSVVFDVKTLFSGSNLSESSQCHSGGPACPPLFTSVGLDIVDGGNRLSTAPVYRVE